MMMAAARLMLLLGDAVERHLLTEPETSTDVQDSAEVEHVVVWARGPMSIPQSPFDRTHPMITTINTPKGTHE